MNPCNLNQLGLSRDEPWAVGHFNIHNQEFIRAVVRAAETERSPAILAVGMMSVKYMGLEPLISACQSISRETEVPIAVHLDHARDLEIVKAALELGINSVMFDGSSLDFEENVQKTTNVVQMAHDFGATAEGEIGIVPHGTASVSQAQMTDPALAVEFAGASGVIDEQIGQAINHGIRKINVNTGLKVVLKSFLSRRLQEEPESDLLQDLDKGMEAVSASVARRMQLFGSSKKA